MFGILSNTIKSYTSSGSALLRQLQDQNINNESFFKEIENWRNLQLNYTSKISQIINNLRDKTSKIHFKQLSKESTETKAQLEKNQQQNPVFCANLQLLKFFQIIVDYHKSFLSKINYDIFLVNYDNSQKLLTQSKKLLEQQKQQVKQMNYKKDQLQKVFFKKEKLKKQKQQEQMLQIFMSDSLDTTMDQKIRKKNKIKQIQKQTDEYEIKVKETIEEYRKICDRNKDNFTKLKTNNNQQSRCKMQTLLKLQLHFTTYWKNLILGFDDASINQFKNNYNNIYSHDFDKMEKRQDEMIKKLYSSKVGFMENSLRLINQNLIDQLIDYSKDKDVKGKIKRMMESNDVNPEETDEVSRQVKLIKKVLAQDTVDQDCINIFKGIINKNSKLRMNFVFVLQFFRINNQFEININRIHSLHCLISQFLESCFINRDSFVLKQLMILLMTYYVNHVKENNQIEKIYIIHFFRKNCLWRDIEYWQSVLVQCIYLQKRNTINMMMINETGNFHKKKEHFEAERLAILNQMLMVVRNMVIFQFTQKQVKNFATRFIKLLKQDEKFHKDIFNTIEDAVKQESKLYQQQKQSIKNFYISNLNCTKTQQQYRIPEEVRRTYTQ